MFGFIAEEMHAIFVKREDIRIPGIYPCVRSIPVKNKKNFFILEFKLELELGLKLE